MYQLTIIFTFLYSFCVSAIFIQHDIPVERYREFALQSQFEPVGQLHNEGSSCTAFLIDRYTLVTAAHCISKIPKTDAASFENMSFILSAEHDASNLIGARVPWSSPTKDFYGNDPTQPDIAVLYLEKPLKGVTPAVFSERKPTTLLRSEVEFASFGPLVNGIGEELSKLHSLFKHAGRNQILSFDESDGMLSGAFRYSPDNSTYLNARPSHGGSGGPIMIREKDGARSVVAVHAKSVESKEIPNNIKYGTAWRSLAVHPFLGFLRDSSAFRLVKTTPACAGGCQWEELSSWQGTNHKVQNYKGFDEFGTQLRRFWARVEHPISANTLIDIDHVQVEASALALGSGAKIESDKFVARDARLTISIDDFSNSLIQARNDVIFKNSTMIVDFNLNLPNGKQKASHSINLRESPEFGCPCCRSLMTFLGSTGLSLDFGESECGKKSKKTPKTLEWKVVIAQKSVSGSLKYVFKNAPAGWDISIIRDNNSIVVQANRK